MAFSGCLVDGGSAWVVPKFILRVLDDYTRGYGWSAESARGGSDETTDRHRDTHSGDTPG